MRVLPLIPDTSDPGPWTPVRDLELRWSGAPHPGWAGAVRGGLGVHALHLEARPWDTGLVEIAAAALGARLGADFLVIPAPAPEGRRATAAFLVALTALLEATHPQGVKLALRPEPGAAAGLAALLKEVRGEAVGFCWVAGVGGDLEALSDRLFCAIGGEDTDCSGLQRLGYRWNLAIEAPDPELFAARKARLEAAHPPVLFPSERPTHALGRPIQPDEGVTFGRGWGRR